MHRSCASYQNRRAGALGSGYDVEHEVQAVDQVNVERTRRSEHNLRAFGPSAGRVARKIMLAEIGLCFCDLEPVFEIFVLSDERGSEKFAREMLSWPVEKAGEQD